MHACRSLILNDLQMILNVTVHLMKRDITNGIKSWIWNTIKTLHFFVSYLQFKLNIKHICMVGDNAMGRISSSDYLMQIPWGEIRYLLFVCWHRKYCISIENHYWTYLKKRKSVMYHDPYLFFILCTSHEQYFPW